jgi:hypothetical protein
MLEPAITPISTIFYRLFHEERVNMKIDPFQDGQPDSQRKPFEANQAIPTLMFLKKQDLFIKKFPCFQLIENRYLSMFAYPLTGGFKSWCLIPGIFVKPLLRIEDFILPVIGKFLAFRMLVILEKRSA